MADAGTSQLTVSTPNADQMGVAGALENLAAYIVQAQAAWDQKDGATVNDLLQAFWQAKAQVDPGTANAYQSDIIKLDAYSHRLLGFEYMWAISFSDPADIPSILALEVEQFSQSVQEFSAIGLTQQAADDQLILSQAQGYAAQDASNWIDASYLASVKQVIANDISAAGNLISSATSGLFGAIPTSWYLYGAAVLAGLLWWRSKR